MLLPLLTKEYEHVEDLHRAGVGDKLGSSVDELLRETVRALAKLAELKANQRPIAEAEQAPQRASSFFRSRPCTRAARPARADRR